MASSNLPLELLEAFALADDRDAVLQKLVPGSASAALITALAEQKGFDLPEWLAHHVTAFLQENPHSELARAYKLRKQLAGFGKDGASSEDAELWRSLVTATGGGFHDTRVCPDSSAADDAAAASAPSSLLPTYANSLEEASIIKNALYAGNQYSPQGGLRLSHYAHEHPAVIAAFTKKVPAEASAGAAGEDGTLLGNALLAIFENAGGASFGGWEGADVPALLTRAALESAWAGSSGQRQRLLDAVLPHLTAAQLASLATAAPSLKGQTAWLAASVTRLTPAATVDLRADASARAAYLQSVAALAFPGEEAWTAAGASTSVAVPPAGPEGVATPVALYAPLQAVVLHWLLRDAAGDASFLTTPRGRGLLERYLALPRRGAGWTGEKAPAFVGKWQVLNARGELLAIASVFTGRGIGGGGAGASRGALPVLDALALPRPSVAEDEKLVRSCLVALFAGLPPLTYAGTDLPARIATACVPWSAYVDPVWLGDVFARARLTRGTDADRTAALALMPLLRGPGGSSAALKALQDKVALKFLPPAPGPDGRLATAVNPEFLPSPSSLVLARDGPLTLKLKVKGLASFQVRVFELSTTAFYTSSNGAEVSTDIDLEGLVPQHELTVAVPGGDAPMAVSTVAVPLPVLHEPVSAPCGGALRRGIYVVEAVGKGLASRAVLRVGALRFLERSSVAGHVLTLLDETNTPLPPHLVSVTVDGQTFRSDGAASASNPLAAHEICVPYAVVPTTTPLMLTLHADDGATGWSFSTLVRSWRRAAESYSLEAGFFLPREAALKDNFEATMVVRTRLLLNGSEPAPLSMLVNTCLTITCTDADGVDTRKTVRPLVLASDKDAVVTFAIPPRLRSVNAELTGEVETLANGVVQRLSTSAEVLTLNQIESSSATRTVALRRTTEGFFLYVLGKCGEPPVTPIPLTLQLEGHYLSSEPVRAPLVTDAEGRVALGHLNGFARVRVLTYPTGEGTSTASAVFELPTDVRAYPATVHTTEAGDALWATGSAGAGIQVALPWAPSGEGAGATITGRDVSLLEVRPLSSWQIARWAAGGAPPALPDAGTSYGPNDATPVRDIMATPPPSFRIRHEAATGYLTISGLPAGEYCLVLKRPGPTARKPSQPILIRVLPAPSAPKSPSSLLGNRHLAAGGTLLQVRTATLAGTPTPREESKEEAGEGEAPLPPATTSTIAAPLTVASVTVEGSSSSTGADNRTLVIRVCGGASGPGPALGRDVRVHVFPSVFVPPPATPWDAGKALAAMPEAGLASTQFATAPLCRFLNGRKLGEEVMYVLARQAALAAGGVMPGNLLPRPSLLLNPWSLGTVSTGTKEAAAGTAFAAMADAFGAATGDGGFRSADADADWEAASYASLPSFDFLPAPASPALNLKPEPGTGEIRVPAKALTGAWAGFGDVMLTIIVADAAGAASTTATLPGPGPRATAPIAPACRDLARSPAASVLVTTLTPLEDVAAGAPHAVTVHPLAQVSKVTILDTPGAQVRMSAAASYTRVEVFDSFDKFWGLATSLCTSAALTTEFSFLTTWPTLTPAERRARYSKTASHELHLFAFFRDYAGFFKPVIAPFLACKRTRSFIDHWLLGDDMAGYLSPPVFARLNTLEKALLAARVPGPAAQGIVLALRDAADATPLTPSEEAALFNAALAANAASRGGGEDDLAALLAQAEADREAAVAARMSELKDALRAPPKPSVQPQSNRVGIGAFGGGGGAPCPPPLAKMAMAPGAPARSMSRGGPPAPPSASFAASSASMLMADLCMEEVSMESSLSDMREMSKSKKKSAMPVAGFARRMAAPMAKEMASRRRASSDEDEEEEEENADYDLPPEEEGGGMDMGDDDDADGFAGLQQVDDEEASDLARRAARREVAVFQPVNKTEEYAESNYWRVLPNADKAVLIPACKYWADLAAYCAARGAEAGAALGGDAGTRRCGPAFMAALGSAIAARPFVSSALAHVPAAGNTAYSLRAPQGPNGALNAVLAALAVCGLPWERARAAAAALPEGTPPPFPVVTPPAVKLESGAAAALTYTAKDTPVVLYHQDLSSPAPAAPGDADRVLAGQSYADPTDRYVTRPGGMRTEKYLPVTTSEVRFVAPGDATGAFTARQAPTVELVAGKVYEAAVVLTNVSAAPIDVNVLQHLPAGALPVNDGKLLITRNLRLSSYATQSFSYPFYFPRVGTFYHYPLHVTQEEDAALVTAAPFHVIRVVERKPAADATSWASIAANAPIEAVVAHLRTANLRLLDLNLLAWRYKDSAADWRAVLGVLQARRFYHTRTWRYALHHKDAGIAREFLSRPDSLARLRNLLGDVAPVLAHPTPLLALGVGEAGVPGSPNAAPSTVADAEGVWDTAIVGDGPDNAPAYLHLEYSPLVNARAHVLGNARVILNKAVEKQYRHLLRVLAAKPKASHTPAERLALVYHWLLQDRVPEALAAFATIPAPADSVAARVAAGGAQAGRATTTATSSWCTLQYDYLAGYLDFYGPSPFEQAGAAAAAGSYYPVATAVAAAYGGHPVPRWAARFQEMAAHLQEALAALNGSDGAADALLGREALTTVAGADAAHTAPGLAGAEASREAHLSRAAGRSKALSLTIETDAATLGKVAVLRGTGLASATLRFYKMDLELLFSTAPFLLSGTGGAGSLGRFSTVRPNGTLGVTFPAAPASSSSSASEAAVVARVPIPEAYAASDVMVEAVAPQAGLRAAAPCFANRIHCTLSAALGRLTVVDAATGAPLPRTYVKVYWREASSPPGAGKFFKDCYTDIRGSADVYALSTDELSRAERLAVFVSSETHGSLVREVVPPRVG